MTAALSGFFNAAWRTGTRNNPRLLAFSYQKAASMTAHPKKRLLALLLCLAISGAAAGCGALPLTLAGALPVIVSSAGGGVAYTVTNIAYKTFSYPIDDVEDATEQALGKMKITPVERIDNEDGFRIVARTKKLDIYIDVEKITPATTKIKVNAKQGVIFKDKATATEIIEQTNAFLESTDESESASGEHIQRFERQPLML